MHLKQVNSSTSSIDVTSSLDIDHKISTKAETKYTYLHILNQYIALDQDYGTMFEQRIGEYNTNTDGLNHFEMRIIISQGLLNKIYAMDELNHDEKFDFPLQ